MFEELWELYLDSGIWAQPIVVATLVLFVAGSVMLFTVRLVKKFILFSILALFIPNAIGVVGYIEETDSIQEAVMERGAELSDEMQDAMEDMSVKPLFLGFIGSLVALAVGLVGIIKVRIFSSSP